MIWFIIFVVAWVMLGVLSLAVHHRDGGWNYYMVAFFIMIIFIPVVYHIVVLGKI